MLREVADLTGLSAQVTAALADTYRGPWTHAPGAVFADLAAAVAGGADCIDGVGQRCGDREHAFGAAASTTTMWRLVDDKIDAAHLPGIRAARAQAREKAWAAGAAPDPGDWLHVDIDATITIDHSDRKEQAAPDVEEDLRSSRVCSRSWIAPRSPAGKRWPGCCARATPAPIPPLTTSPCWGGRWSRCRRASGPTPPIPAGPRSWCAAIPPVPPTPSPRRAAPPGWGSPSATPSMSGCATPSKSSTRADVLVSGDRGRRRPARGRLGRRGHRPGRHEPLAGRDPVDPAQGTPPPRRATELHRLRRAPRHRVHHRHRHPVSCPVSSPAWSCATANTPASRTGSAQAKATGLRNLPCHRAEANAAWLEIILAATDLVAWAQADRLHRPSRAGPLRDRHVPLPGPARRRPHHQRRPPNPATHRRHLALGHRHLPRVATTSGSIPLTSQTPSDRPEEPHRPWKARPQRHGPTRHTQHRQSGPTVNQRRIHPTRPGRTKNRG